MTEPKQRLPGTTYFVTMACDRHEFRLRPSPETNAAFAVSMMEAADRFRIDVIAVCQMSSHYHAVFHDRYGLLSEFLRDFHAVMGRFGSARDGVQNCRFWAAGGAHEEVLGDVPSIVEKVAYTLANPTKDFIVARPEEWHGVHTAVDEIGTGRGGVYQRPKRFFDPEGRVSDAVMVWSELPEELLEVIDAERFRRRVKSRVERYVAEAHAKVAAGEARFMGLAEAKKLSVWHRAPGEKGRDPLRSGLPKKRVAAASRGRLRAMLEALVAFRAAHRAALRAFRRGFEALFPSGTWFAWRFYGARRAEGLGIYLPAAQS